MSRESFSKDFMDYHDKVRDFNRNWSNMSDEERERTKASLTELATKVYTDCDFPEYFVILPTLSTFNFMGKTYYCNNDPFGENKGSSMERKNVVPLEWCILFSKKDRVFQEKHTVNGEEIISKSSQYRTTVEKALKRLKIIDEESHLVKWLEKYPSDALLVLDYGELFMNNNFNEKDIVKVIEICDNCTKVA
jgi:hypothetical protein